MTKVAALLVALAITSCTSADAPEHPISVESSRSPVATSGLLTPTADACTTTGSQGEDVLVALFRLASSGDGRSVADCYAAPYRTQHATFDDLAGRWSRSGPAQVFSIRKIDRVNGCDRFAVEAQLDHGEAVAWVGRMTIFYSVGPDVGRMRIWDGGTGLAAPEYTTMVCG